MKEDERLILFSRTLLFSPFYFDNDNENYFIFDLPRSAK